MALAAALALGAGACGGNDEAEPSVPVAGGPSLTLTPSDVQAGSTVSMEGSADGCPAGDTVSLLSRAFPPEHEFAGVPAVLAEVGADGSFQATATIPAGTAPGSYDVTGRCGGGNLGFLEHLTVQG